MKMDACEGQKPQVGLQHGPLKLCTPAHNLLALQVRARQQQAHRHWVLAWLCPLAWLSCPFCLWTYFS